MVSSHDDDGSERNARIFLSHGKSRSNGAVPDSPIYRCARRGNAIMISSFEQ